MIILESGFDAATTSDLYVNIILTYIVCSIITIRQSCLLVPSFHIHVRSKGHFCWPTVSLCQKWCSFMLADISKLESWDLRCSWLHYLVYIAQGDRPC